MFVPRKIRTSAHWQDRDGCKLYTISADGSAVDHAIFESRLLQVKSARPLAWGRTPHFAILHRGTSSPYLILCWWGNDNELFTSVSVLADGNWVEDPARYSFCLYDLEIIWDERNHYIQTMDRPSPDLMRYREGLRSEWDESTFSATY